MTDTAVATAPRRIRDYGHSFWQRLIVSRESAIVALLIIVAVVASLSVRGFSQPITLTFLLMDVAPTLLIALPMTCIMITGEIDLSVGSMVGLSSVTVGALIQAHWPFGAAAIAALLVGVVGGAVNGFLVTVVGLPSLAVTIGTLALYRGIAVGILGTTAVTDFPKQWTALAQATVSGTTLPYIMVPFVVLLVIFVVLLHFTPFGRGIYAVGLSKDAATFSGVHVERTKMVLFVLSGVISAFAGIFYTLRFGTARGDNATGLELQVIAAVVLGGVSVFGGRGKIYGVVAAVLLIGSLSSALRLANITSDVINIITGALLIVSVVGASVLNWAQRARRRPTQPPAPIPVATSTAA